MSHEFGRQPFPRAPLIAAGALVGTALVLATLGSVGRVGRTELTASPIVGAYELRFDVRQDGTTVVSLPDGRPVDVLASGTDGFARGVLHSVARERRRVGAPLDAPLRLTRYADGRLGLADPSSRLEVDLGVFGPTNAETFARLWRASDALRVARANAT